jgi:leucyl-tRNA synthetase
MFLGPVGGVYPWNTDGLDGIRKWLERVYRIFLEMPEIIFTDDLNAVDNSWVCAYNLFIKKATDDLENIKLNLVVSEMMVFINECYKQKQLYIPYMKNFLIVLSCYAPHLTEEINSAKFNANTLIYNSQWPTYDPTKIVTTTVNLPIQINGKFRETIEVPCGIDENTAVNLAKANEKISKLLENKSIKKIIYVADKILNFIVSDK